MLLKVSDNINLVLSKAGFTYCNCIFINDEIRTIIDTGADTKSLAELYPDKMDMVLYTHHHYDHTRGHELFSQAKFYIHELDYPALQSIEDFEFYNSLDKWEELMPEVERTEGIATLNIPVNNQDELLVDFQGTFTDGKVFDLGHTYVEVIHTPGHSAGHCSFYFPDVGFLFTGDICLTAAGPWYGEVYADPNDMIKSIDKIIELKPKTIGSCHINSICDNPVERLIEFKNRIFKRDERIYNFLKHKPADIHELACNKLIYHYHPTPFVVFWEKLMLIKHLKRLKEMNMVKEVQPGLYIAK